MRDGENVQLDVLITKGGCGIRRISNLHELMGDILCYAGLKNVELSGR
jgi:hypothetical protein